MARRKEFRVGLIGGGIGRQHMLGYVKLPDLFKVVTVCDIDARRATSVAALSEGCTTTPDIEVLLADPSIDIIDVCLPPSLHFPVSMRALKAGKHVVCEKPLAGSIREADELARAAKKAGRVLAPVFQYRFGSGFSKLRRLIESGVAGKPLVASVETQWHRGADYYDLAWRGSWEGELGGAVLGHAIHNHDLLDEYFGPVRRVAAFCATRVNDIAIEDCASIALEMESGAGAVSSVTLGAANDITRFRFCFANLTAESGLQPYNPAADEWTFTARPPTPQATVDRVIAEIGPETEGFAGLFAELHRSLSGQKSRAVTLADGRRSIELVTAIYESSRTGKFVTLPIRRSDPFYKRWAPPKRTRATKAAATRRKRR
jgi:predicted dehydrogenase